MTDGLQRRLFIKELGGATLAIAVLGPLGACATTKTQTTLLPPATTGASATTPLVATSTTQTTLRSSTTTGAPATTAPVATTPSCTRVPPVIAGERVKRIKFAGTGEWYNPPVSAYLMVRGTEVALVDTGYSGDAGNIEAALSTVGLGWDNVGHVIATHAHSDHAGGLSGAMELATEAVAYAGSRDIGGISYRPLLPLLDGDSVFGLDIISTPGHTSGHISVHDPQGRTLFVGDSLVGSGAGWSGGVQGVGGTLVYNDIDKLVASAKKMALLDFDTLYFGHGHPVLSCADEALRAYVATL